MDWYAYGETGVEFVDLGTHNDNIAAKKACQKHAYDTYGIKRLSWRYVTDRDFLDSYRAKTRKGIVYTYGEVDRGQHNGEAIDIYG